jgi:hypothetical protein
MGVPEGAIWGLASAISFAVHLVRSEMRQYEAQDIVQLAAAQLIVCGILSLLLLGVEASLRPVVAAELNPQVIMSVCTLCLPLQHARTVVGPMRLRCLLLLQLFRW